MVSRRLDATVDGVEVPLVRANYILRALPIDAGQEVVLGLNLLVLELVSWCLGSLHRCYLWHLQDLNVVEIELFSLSNRYSNLE